MIIGCVYVLLYSTNNRSFHSNKSSTRINESLQHFLRPALILSHLSEFVLLVDEDVRLGEFRPVDPDDFERICVQKLEEEGG